MDYPEHEHDPSHSDAHRVDAPPTAVNTSGRPRMDHLYEHVRRVYLTADTRSLALGRIVLSLVLLRDLIGRWLELGLWYTNDGIIPNHSLLWRPPWDHIF